MDKSQMSVKIYEKTDFAYLIVTAPNITDTSCANSTYIFSIDKTNGGIMNFLVPKIDIFSSFEEADNNLAKLINNNFVPQKRHGVALIGATVCGNKLIIALVKKCKVAAKFNNHKIYEITKIKYKCIPLISGKDEINVSLNTLDISDKHYFFCPTADLTKHFPYPVLDYSTQNDFHPFCWNERFIFPFKENNSPNVCVVIFKGLVQKFVPNNPIRNCNEIVYITKISSEKNHLNECEYELVFVAEDEFYSYTWKQFNVKTNDDIISNSSCFDALFESMQSNKNATHMISFYSDNKEKDFLTTFNDRFSNYVMEKNLSKVFKYKNNVVNETQIKDFFKNAEISFSFMNNKEIKTKEQSMIYHFICLSTKSLKTKVINDLTLYFTSLLTSLYAYKYCDDLRSDKVCEPWEPAEYIQNDVYQKLSEYVRISENSINDFQHMNINQYNIWTGSKNKLKNPKFLLHERYISEFKNTRDDAIEYYVMFPEPFILCGVLLKVSNNSSGLIDFCKMTIATCDNSKKHNYFFDDIQVPSINRKCYDLIYNLREIANNSSCFPMNKQSLKQASFVIIKINCSNKNIMFDLKYIVKRPKNRIIFEENNCKEKVLFDEILNKHAISISEKPDLEQLLNLEKDRIITGIPNLRRNDYFIDKKINPWIYDLVSQMICTKKEGKCCFCEKNVSNDDPIPICPNCKEIRPEYCINNKLREINEIRTSKSIFPFSKLNNYIKIFEIKNLDWEKAEECFIKKSSVDIPKGMSSIELFFNACSSPERITLYVDVSNFANAKKYLKMTVTSNPELKVELNPPLFKASPKHQFIKYTFKNSRNENNQFQRMKLVFTSESEEKISIEQISITGYFSPRRIFIKDRLNKERCSEPPFLKCDGNNDNDFRTQKFEVPCSVKGFAIPITSPENYPKNMVFSFYINGSMILYYYILLPTTDSGCKYFYYLIKDIGCKKGTMNVNVFYLDRINKFAFHKIQFF